jgi:hypothetical protein
MSDIENTYGVQAHQFGDKLQLAVFVLFRDANVQLHLKINHSLVEIRW